MKNIIISIIMILVLTIVTKSQDKPPSPLTFTYKANDTVRTNQPLKREYFQQHKVVLGTQWYGHPRMLKALKMNFQHGTPPNGPLAPILPNPDSATYKMYHIWDYRDYDDALGFEYKPTLYIPEADRGKFITNANDPARPVFGFSHRNGTVVSPSDPGDINYRLGLYPGSMGSYSADSIVLKKAWLNNKHLLLPSSFIS